MEFWTGNWGEFSNAEFLEMCEAMKIKVKVIAAESPFSNGLVEKHNLIMADGKISWCQIWWIKHLGITA